MNDFISEYYLWVAIPTQIIGFVLVYITQNRNWTHQNEYLFTQAVVTTCALLWPIAFMLVVPFTALVILYAVFAGLIGIGTWLADKTIGKLMKGQE
tara:strand:+ start:250 stop:537 length:288 start_codon:yes stop_codon:yes gene_type:complete